MGVGKRLGFYVGEVSFGDEAYYAYARFYGVDLVLAPNELKPRFFVRRENAKNISSLILCCCTKGGVRGQVECSLIKMTYFSRRCRVGYWSSMATSSLEAPMMGTHLCSSDATSTAWMNCSLSSFRSYALALLSLRFESTDLLSLVAFLWRLCESKSIHPSSSASLSLSNSMRSLAGERRDALVGAFRLRCGSRRRSSVDEGYGELLLARDEAVEAMEEVAFGESLRTGDDRADDDSPGRATGFGFGLGAMGRSMTTFSMRILGGSTLNLLLFPLRRGMMAASK